MTTGTPRFAESDAAFSELVNTVQAQVDPESLLPDWPFKAATGYATIYEYDRVLGSSFGLVLEALVAAYRDDVVTIVGFEPRASYYRDEYQLFPGFQVSRDGVRNGYRDGLKHEPGGDPTGSLGITLNVIAVAGNSGSWAVWGQRDWEIGLLLTRDPSGPWLDAGVSWFSPDVDLDSIRSPAGWGVPLSKDAYATFRRNIRERGSGQ